MTLEPVKVKTIQNSGCVAVKQSFDVGVLLPRVYRCQLTMI